MTSHKRFSRRNPEGFGTLAESKQPSKEVQRDMLIEGARALRRARTDVETAGGMTHPLVPHLEFKATQIAKSAARITKLINEGGGD